MTVDDKTAEKVNQELEMLRSLQGEWQRSTDAMDVPPALVALGHITRDTCCEELARLLDEGKDNEECGREHANYFISTLLFGMFLNKKGYTFKSFTPFPEMTLSEDDIRRLLNG